MSQKKVEQYKEYKKNKEQYTQKTIREFRRKLLR